MLPSGSKVRCVSGGTGCADNGMGTPLLIGLAGSPCSPVWAFLEQQIHLGGHKLLERARLGTIEPVSASG